MLTTCLGKFCLLCTYGEKVSKIRTLLFIAFLGPRSMED